MDQPMTCGQGLAHHAALPGRLAHVFAAIAENLETHLTALDPTNKGSRREFDAYVALATEHREIESRLRALAVQMESYRDLPMAEHDMTVLNSRDASNALERLMAQETELAALLQEWVEQYQGMLKASTRVP